MKNLFALRCWMIGASLGIFAALLIAPSSRPLVIEQACAAFGIQTASDSAATHDARALEAVRRHPNDIPLQFAAMQSQPTLNTEIDRLSPDPAAHERQRLRWMKLQTLAARYPNSPFIFAVILRTAFSGAVDLPLTGDDTRSTKTIPSDAALFDQDAAKGERLDPQNVYFPLMRAAGFYAMGRDADAEAAVLRAGTKPRWNEDVAEETEGKWRLADAINGGPIDPMSRAAISSAMLFNHYPALREISRRVVAEAARDEKAGRIAEGIALRHAIMHCGGLMRAQSTSTIGSLVGIAIAKEGLKRPGGAPDLTRHPGESVSQLANIRLEQYCAFLTRNGYSGESRWVRAETSADEQVRLITQQAMDSRLNVDFALFERLMPLLTGGVIVLMNILWVLLIGGIASFLLWWKSRQMRNDAYSPPMPKSALAIAALLVLAALMLGPAFVPTPLWTGNYPDTMLASSIILILTGIAALIVQAIRRQISLAEAGRTVVFGLAIAAVGLCALGFWFWQAMSMRGIMGWDRQPQTTETIKVFLRFGLWIIAAPFVLLLVLTIISLARRIPISAGLSRGFAAAAVPVATLFVIGYAGTILATMRQESRLTRDLTRQVQNEGLYLASLTGSQWPGVVPDEHLSSAGTRVVASAR